MHLGYLFHQTIYLVLSEDLHHISLLQNLHHLQLLPHHTFVLFQLFPSQFSLQHFFAPQVAHEYYALSLLSLLLTVALKKVLCVTNRFSEYHQSLFVGLLCPAFSGHLSVSPRVLLFVLAEPHNELYFLICSLTLFQVSLLELNFFRTPLVTYEAALSLALAHFSNSQLFASTFQLYELL